MIFYNKFSSLISFPIFLDQVALLAGQVNTKYQWWSYVSSTIYRNNYKYSAGGEDLKDFLQLNKELEVK